MATAKGAPAPVDDARDDATLPAQVTGSQDLSDVLGDLEDYANAGMETVKGDDLLVPRLGILQALSPQVKPNKPEYNPEARPGMICDLGMGEVFPDGIIFLPVSYRKEWIEWAPRDTGKGIGTIHPTDEILKQTRKDDLGRSVLPSGYYVVETAQFYGLNLTAGGRRCFIPMASTQLKKARRLLTLSQGEKLTRRDGSEFVPPMFYRSYSLTTVDESNTKGDWAGWVIQRSKSLPELADMFDVKKLREDAIDFLETIAAGNLRGDVSDIAAEASDEKAM